MNKEVKAILTKMGYHALAKASEQDQRLMNVGAVVTILNAIWKELNSKPEDNKSCCKKVCKDC